MASLYHFRWTKPGIGDILVVVTTEEKFNQQDLTNIVDQETLGEHPYPDALVVIAPKDVAAAVKTSVKRSIASGPTLRLANATIPVLVVEFDPRGRLKVTKSSAIQGTISLTDNDFKGMLQAGIVNLAQKREAVLVAPPGHHFVHPRKRHSAAFLRAANMLIQGEEIGFLSLVLLPHLNDNIQKIWVDSSSIASLVYSAYLLKSRLNGTFLTPRIESFSSYEGIKNLTVQDPEREVVLISATATGSLPKEVSNLTKLPDNRVITLFSTAEEVTGTLIFDARAAMSKAELAALRVHEETDCEWCRDGSRTITFVGDQFLADAATVSAHIVVHTDAPPSLKKVMKKYRGKRAFSLKRDPVRNVHRLHVDLDKTLLDEEARDQIRILLRRHAPASTSHVLAVGENDSRKFAEIVADEIANFGLPRPRQLDANNLIKEDEDRHGVIVVSASIGAGQSLQDASRDLREPFKSLPRTFFAGLRKHAVATHQTTLQRDLEHNNDAPKHVICVVDEMTLPHPNQFSAWATELRFWHAVANDLRMNDPINPALPKVEERIVVLSGDISADHFFLPTGAGFALRLRPSFAFWDPDYDGTITQGDVFATISSILESCRKVSKAGQTKAPLAQSPFHYAVLASENFTRFNDGIIQACFLRAAFPHELNFAHAETAQHSVKICNMILKMLSDAQDTQAEACLEFLVALATKRISLASGDVARLAGHPRLGLPDLIALTLAYAVGKAVDHTDEGAVDPPA
ncbi:hypothetical protein [Mesorhizobium sp. M0590]|uniref:hypothetical protein n=1 Tax=unclassified Mesorhizobium TaxID=325217 RepID=UPI003335AA9F